MIQDIAPQVYRNEFKPRAPEDEDLVFCFSGRKVLVKTGETGLLFPLVREMEDRKPLLFLFRIEGRCCFLWYGKEHNPFGEYTYELITALRVSGPPAMAFAGMTAYHLAAWYRDTVYCGRCGERLTFSQQERAMVCPHCGNTIYPKICPAVIVCVRNGDQIVVTRYAGRPYRGVALIAGFCEIGETAEDTVRREVMEEVGLHVKNIQYYASQPWGFESDLLLGFYCDVDGDPTIHRDPGELAVAEWRNRKDLEKDDRTISLTADMIERFRQGKA